MDKRFAFLPCKSREPEVAGVGELERSGMLTYLSVLAGKRRGVPVPGPERKSGGQGSWRKSGGGGRVRVGADCSVEGRFAAGDVIWLVCLLSLVGCCV